eukprot:1694596-Rhodomonas_salina.1
MKQLESGELSGTNLPEFPACPAYAPGSGTNLPQSGRFPTLPAYAREYRSAYRYHPRYLPMLESGEFSATNLPYFPTLPTPQNLIQETAFSEQIVPAMRFLVLEFAV